MRIQLSDHFTFPKLLRFVFPTIIMMVFTSIYGVIDGFFVSNFTGKTSFAAINLIMPFICIIGGMGFMIGTGGTALVSKVLGEKDRPQANRYFSMMVWFTLLFGGILSLLGAVFMEPVALFLGATEEMLHDCVLYGRIVTGFSVAFMFQNIFQSFFITAEKPKLGLYATVAAGLTNMFLDALFIAVFHWGVVGAAVATGLSQCVGGILPIFYFAFPNDSLLRLTKTKLELKPILKACGNGASELLGNTSTCIVGILTNFQLLRLIGEDGVAAYGILMYTRFIYIAVFLGFSIGSAPIIGYNFGAQNHAELHNMLKKSILFMAVSGLIMTGIAYGAAPFLSRLAVGYDAELCALTIRAFRIYSFPFLIMGFNIFVSGFFTALNNGAISAAVSFIRTLVLQIAALLILPIFLDADGVWLAILVSEAGSFLVSLFFLIIKQKKYQY